MRILGVDPGLTRCGLGIIDVSQTRALAFVHVEVVQTPTTMPLAQRLLTIRQRFEEVLGEYIPERLALERVFSQHNVRTVMGTAQVSGLVLAEAAARSLPIDLHTPSEVKAAVTGNGRAGKEQVASMVNKLMTLPEGKFLPDATDALAIAVCNAWRGGSGVHVSDDSEMSSETPAQRIWRDAERHSRKRG